MRSLRHKQEIKLGGTNMKSYTSYIVELHKIRKVEIAATNSQDAVGQAKTLYPDYEIFGFKLAEEQEEKVNEQG